MHEQDQKQLANQCMQTKELQYFANYTINSKYLPWGWGHQHVLLEIIENSDNLIISGTECEIWSMLKAIITQDHRHKIPLKKNLTFEVCRLRKPIPPLTRSTMSLNASQ